MNKGFSTLGDCCYENKNCSYHCNKPKIYKLADSFYVYIPIAMLNNPLTIFRMGGGGAKRPPVPVFPL